METAGQIQQPIPLFYGPLGGGVTTQALQSGFDYVMTGYWATCNEASAPFVCTACEVNGNVKVEPSYHAFH